MRNVKWTLVLLIAMAALLCAAVGGTMAHLVAATQPVANTFTAPSLETGIQEDFDGSVKNRVRIANTGNVKDYIRAAVVVTWQDAQGNVCGQAPQAGTDYSISWTKDGWISKGNYYYYTAPVAPGGATGVLFTNCSPLKAAPAEGYALHVEIISEAIQAEPAAAVADAWGVTLNADGTISG